MSNDNIEELDVKRIEAVINDMMPGLTMYVRDANLNANCAAAYKPGMVLLERAFTDATNRVMGMATTYRFAILSNHMADLRDDGDAGTWGLFVADHHSHFKVLDVYEYQGLTQILLLHYPDDDSWKLFSNAEFNLETDLVKSCRERFENKCKADVIPELVTEDWLERCEKPIGMDEDGILYDLEEKPEILPEKIKKIEYAIIINIIRNGLVQDPEKDTAYLERKMEQYKHHILGKEIIRECGRILYEVSSEDKKKKLSSIIDNEFASVEERLDGIRKLMSEGKLTEAKKKIDALANEADHNSMFREDNVSQYFCFREWFEECLYRHMTKPTKELRKSQYPYDEIYILQGVLAVEMRNFEIARKALRKALEWNPMHANAAFEYAETFRMEGDMEHFFEESKKIQKICFHSKDVAHFLRNAGYYYGEIGQYDKAMMCIVRSAVYDNEPEAVKQELIWLHEEHGVPLPKITSEKCKKFEQENGFPLGADNDVLGWLYSYSKHFIEEHETDGARYCLGLLYDLTGDPDVRKMIDSLPEQK